MHALRTQGASCSGSTENYLSAGTVTVSRDHARSNVTAAAGALSGPESRPLQPCQGDPPRFVSRRHPWSSGGSPQVVLQSRRWGPGGGAASYGLPIIQTSWEQRGPIKKHIFRLFAQWYC